MSTAIVEETLGEGPATVDGRRPRTRHALVSLGWLAAASVLVTAGYALVAARNRGFFLVDDTENALLPMFSHLGHELRNGTWPAVSERNWTVGLVAADPQYGVFNPLSLFTYWLVEPMTSLVWRTFVLVLLHVNLLVAGVFWAARALGSSAPFAALAGVIAGLNVFVLYWQAAGWLTLVPGISWFVLAVAALLAAAERPDRRWRSVVAGLLTAMAMVSGSPHAVIAFMVAAVAIAAWTLAGRDLTRRLRRHSLTIAATVSGAAIGAVPWIVTLAYLPYTKRLSGLFNRGFLTLHLESLLMSFSPSIHPFTQSFPGSGYLDQPVTYGSWLFAPAVALAVVRRVRFGRSHWAVLVAGVTLFLMTLGPEVVGPIRWPIRFVPFALMLLAVATVMTLDRASDAPPRSSRDRRLDLVVATVVLAGVSYLITTSVLAALVTAAVLGAGVPLVVWCVRRGRRTVLIAAGLAVTWVIWAAIVIASPHTSDLVDRFGPTDIETARQDLRPLSGHRTLELVGPIPPGPDSVLGTNYSLYATDDSEVINAYTPLVPRGLGNLLCLTDPGTTCPQAATTIFEREPTTGLRYVDLLGVSQIMVQRGPWLDNFERARSPEWVPTLETKWWVMYGNGTRLGESPVVWTSDGVTVERTRGTDQVTVPAGGELVLSRPLWPGTQVTVGGVTADLDPVADVFVRAVFRQPTSGDLSIRHHVPARSRALAAAVTGIVGLMACAVAAAVVTSRDRRAEPRVRCLR